MPRHMHLNLFIHSRGHHEASWRHPKASAADLADIDFYTQMALTAERGMLDSIFLADQLVVSEDIAHAARTWLEPITALGAIAQATQNIGLIATASSTYTEAFNLARQFASLDHISKGRIGWNIVTSWAANAGRNFNISEQITHAERYVLAEEYVQICKALWDSWGDDAVVDDRASGLYARRDDIKPINHRGAHFNIAGPLNLPRCPQGRPVLVQAGSSETGRDFAARHAEAVFTAHLEKETAQAFYADLKARVTKHGRDPAQVHILPGLSLLLGSTEEEALRRADELNALADTEVGRRRLSARFGGHDFSHLPLDEPLSTADFPDPATVEAARSRTEVIVGLVKREATTLRQLLAKLAGARGHFTFAGTPEQAADLMEDWFVAGAADGFNLMPPVLPWMLDAFVDEVLPILRQRGLFRSAYEGSTLRSHFGLPRPAVQRG